MTSIDTSNLSVPATHGKVAARKLSRASFKGNAVTRARNASGENLSAKRRDHAAVERVLLEVEGSSTEKVDMGKVKSAKAEREPMHTEKARPLPEKENSAFAKGARPRMGSKCDPLEKFVPALGKDCKKVPPSKKQREDAEKFLRQMEKHMYLTGRFCYI